MNSGKVLNTRHVEKKMPPLALLVASKTRTQIGNVIIKDRTGGAYSHPSYSIFSAFKKKKAETTMHRIAAKISIHRIWKDFFLQGIVKKTIGKKQPIIKE